jgi:hypothetical protein
MRRVRTDAARIAMARALRMAEQCSMGGIIRDAACMLVFFAVCVQQRRSRSVSAR